METPAWRALPPVAQALYPWLKLEWHGPKNNNNGKIRLSVRQAATKLGVSINTAAKGFRALQAKGFIEVTQTATLGVGGHAKAQSYLITELGNSGPKEDTGPRGKQKYLEWRNGHDFEIVQPRTNNPFGKNKSESPS